MSLSTRKFVQALAAMVTSSIRESTMVESSGLANVYALQRKVGRVRPHSESYRAKLHRKEIRWLTLPLYI